MLPPFQLRMNEQTNVLNWTTMKMSKVFHLSIRCDLTLQQRDITAQHNIYIHHRPNVTKTIKITEDCYLYLPSACISIALCVCECDSISKVHTKFRTHLLLISACLPVQLGISFFSFHFVGVGFPLCSFTFSL